MEHVGRTEAESKVAMLPRVGKVEAWVVPVHVVSDPLTIGMDVRSVGMAFHVAEIMMRFLAVMFVAMRWCGSRVLRLSTVDWGRAMRRYIAAADVAARLLLFAPAVFLCADG